MECKYCKQNINVEVKLISFIGTEMFVQCPHCSELVSETHDPENLEIIRLTYNEKKYL